MSTAEQQLTGGGVGRLSLVTTTAIMVAAVTAFFFLFVALFFLYLRAKRYWGAIPVSGPAHTQPASSSAPRRRGLDAAAVEALPSVVLCAGDPNEGVECAVCLSELGEGDAARLLPRCGHAFHLECIDKWFCSHSTCPLCRAAAEVEEVKIACSGARLVLGNAPSMDSSSDFAERFQSCVLGDCASDRNLGSTEGSSNTSESSSDLTASMSTNRLSEAEMRPPTSQTLRSLRKLLIVGSRMAGASCSNQGFDIERGCPPAEKTPSTS